MNLNLEQLKKLYYDEGYSTRDLASFFNVGQTTIRRFMHKNNLTLRSSKEGKLTKHFKEKSSLINALISSSITNFYKNNGNLIKKTCPYCNKEFEIRKSSNKLYCCKECANAAKRVNTIKDSSSNTVFYKNVCSICGKQFVSLSRLKFCSSLCKLQFYKQWGEKLTNRVSVNCAYCNKLLHRIPSIITTHNFCDVHCMTNYYRESNLLQGENSPTWKGGKKHYKGHWLRLRMLARKRDNYTCQLCGVHEEEWHKQMDVHHIINYREFEDKDEANQLDNLVCLCNKCHSFVHSNLNTNYIYIKSKILSDLNGDIEHV